VGKSSLLNALAGRKIAKVSGTPGKTQMLNVFVMPAYYLLDLPGYGYARASHVERRAFRLLIQHALERPALAGVLWLLDIRRAPSPDDRAMRELFAERATRVLAAVTKSDKLPHGQRPARVRELCAALELDLDQVVATSARRSEGIEELRDAVAGLVGAAEAR
jgi:GTP-binding protein